MLRYDTDRIFKVSGLKDFEDTAMSVFKFQAKNNSVYKKYLQYLNVEPEKVNLIYKIPFLPVEFFKTHKIISGCKNHEVSGEADYEYVFKSSGTTGSNFSKHYVADLELYERSFLKGFEIFFGDIEEYCILALLPSYLENNRSSLVYMARKLIKKSNHAYSDFYLNNTDELFKRLKELENRKEKTILLGVSFALLDFFEKHKMQLAYTIIMETGGMKGRRKELVRAELHETFKKLSGLVSIHSEYGMTELLSQSYSYGKGIFYTPP